MSFQSYLENLRSKPDHEKKKFAFWTSFSFTMLIFAFWLASFTSTVGLSNSAIAETIEKAGSPTESLIAGVGGFFGGIVDYFFSPKVIEYSELEVVAGDK